MPKFWGATKPAVQKTGGVSWWAALNYAFKLNLPVTIGMTDQAKSVGTFGLSMPLSIGMAAQGISNAAFNLNMPLSIGMRTPTPLGPFNFGLSMPLSMTMQAAEQYARTFNLNMPLSIGMAGVSKSVGAFGLSMPLSIGMQGVYVPLDPIYVDGVAIESATVTTMPTHQAGDLIFMFVFRDGSTTTPTIPAGWTVLNSGGSNSCSAALAYKWAASNAETSGTWTNATGILCQVYRNVMGIGNLNFIGSSSATVNYGPFGFADIDTVGKPWVVCFGAHRSTNATMNVAPAGTINRVNLEGATNDMASFDTNSGYAGGAWPSTNVTTTESSSGYLTFAVELIPLNAAIIENTTLTNVTAPAGKSARVTMRGGGATGGAANRPSSGGWGGGGGGGGAWIKECVIPAASLGSTFSMQQGWNAAAIAGSSSTSGTAGSLDGPNAWDAFFSSGPTTVTAGGGKGGHGGGNVGDSAGGAGGIVTGHTAFTWTEVENGSPGSNGSTTTAAATFNSASNSTHAGPGGGGGGSNRSSAYAGCAGGSSATGAGGAAGTNNGANGPTPADAGGGGGGGTGNAGFGGTGGAGGNGGVSGAGGGGGGGKEGSSGTGGAGEPGAVGYIKVEFI